MEVALIMNKSTLLKLIAVIIVIVVALIAAVPPNAPFMPEEKRFTYYTFPLLPPLLAIALAMATRQVLLALFAGVWIGGLMATGYNPLSATTQTVAWYVENATDSWNASILLYDFVLGAFMGLLYASGSVHSAARAIARKVKSALGASFAGWLLGLAIFFDDYGNTVIVGNTIRPVSDRVRVSRELLSYIVDSTAAPVAGLALVSSWIGYEVGLIKDSFDGLRELATKGIISIAPTIEAYGAWLSSVPFRFYSILAILLVLTVVITRRHFGPMLKAEHRAIKEGKVLRDGAKPLVPTEEVIGTKPIAKKYAPGWVFAISISVLVAITLLGMWVTGAADPSKWWETPFTEALMNADTATALFWAGMATYFTALAGILITKSLSFSQAMDYTIKGMYLMVFPNAILLHAWCIKSATDAVGTADYVVHGAAVAGLPAILVPLLIFLVSMFISFTTGTSWGTFGVMMPIAIPMAWRLALMQFPGNLDIIYTITFASIASVFAGGIFGDHCSPISDTTIMSSMFSAADHIDHVNTQVPYAVLAASVGIVLYLLFAAGVTNPIILLPIGVVLLIIFHYVLSNLYAKKVGLPPKVPNYVMGASGKEME